MSGLCSRADTRACRPRAQRTARATTSSCWRAPALLLIVCATLAACFEVKIPLDPDSGSSAPDADAQGPDAAADAREPDAAEWQDGGTARDGEVGDAGVRHRQCSQPPGGEVTSRFEPPMFWDASKLNSFLAIGEPPLLDLCTSELDCPLGKCLLVNGTQGVCVADTRCEAPLVYQKGRCTSCVRAQEKAKICRMGWSDIDCRPWPPALASGVGGSCAQAAQCEEGLVCAKGRAEPWLGTCVCPGAVVSEPSSFLGCGSPDTPRDQEPDLEVFSKENRPRFMLVGDLLAAEAQNWARLGSGGDGGLELSVNVIASKAALCDFLENRPGPVPAEQRLGRALAAAASRPLHAIALQFWGWATTPCMEGLAPGSEPYYARLLSDASAAVEEIERAAREAKVQRPRLFWVLQGPDREQPERARRVNDIYRRIARYHGDVVSDAGYHISGAVDSRGDPQNRYEWAEFLPCRPMEKTEPLACKRTALIHI